MSKMDSYTRFNLGDRVTWKSQAAGSWKTKVGTIIEVVAAGRLPSKMYSTSLLRNYESYVVEVTYEPKRSTSAIKSVRVKKPKRYWPVVANLSYARGGKALTITDPAAVRPHPTGVTDPVPAHASDCPQGGPPRNGEPCCDKVEALTHDLKSDHLAMQNVEGSDDSNISAGVN